MTDPALALITGIVFLGVLAAVRWFRTLDPAIGRAWATALPAGAVAGLLLRFTGTHPIEIGVVLTVAILYVRLTGDESEPADGMLLGAVAADTAALVLIGFGAGAGRELAACLLAGAAAGYGVTLAARAAGQKMRQFLIDVITAAAAVGCAYAARLAALDDRELALIAAAAVPLIALLTVFKQWRDVRAELSHEAALGFIDAADVRRTAHPFLRLGSGTWSDRRAHRVFVRLATLLALRKRQQRNRPEAIARLYQLEIIKLRMQIQEMSRINHAVANAPAQDGETPDTIARNQ
jgi:hypothetical protein